MSIPLLKDKRAWATAMALGICAMIAIATPLPRPARGAENPKDSKSGFTDELKNWQEKISESLHDAFKRVDGGDADSPASVSADLREQSDSYVLRLHLPGRTLDKVEVTFGGDTLHVLAPEEGKAQRYEQSMKMEGASRSAKLQIDRLQANHLIVVTVPKASVKGPGLARRDDREGLRRLFPNGGRDIMNEMERMQREMDRIFEDSFQGFKETPDLKGFFDEHRFGSTYTVDEQDGAYVVRAQLPDRDMTNVQVSVAGEILTIEAQPEQVGPRSKGEEDASTLQTSLYTQRISLPGPVRALKMKVEQKDGMVIVTLPKTGTS